MADQNTEQKTAGAEVHGRAKMLNVEVVIRNPDGTVKEKRVQVVRQEE